MHGIKTTKSKCRDINLIRFFVVALECPIDEILSAVRISYDDFDKIYNQIPTNRETYTSH